MSITTKFIILGTLVVPAVAHAAGDFSSAAKMLAAARNGDGRQIQVLIREGADINYIDNTGLSLVCTAMLNNDMAAVRILQNYGADASDCSNQIKNYNARNVPADTGGMLSGLSTTQSMALAGAGVAAAVGGIVLLSDVFNPDNDNPSTGGSSGGSGGGSGGGSSGNTNGTEWSAGALPAGPTSEDNYADNLAYFSPSDTSDIQYKNFTNMNAFGNYMLLMRGYSPLARGYLGARTLRDLETHAPLSISSLGLGQTPLDGGRPVNVALITANGINAADDTSLQDKFIVWTTNSGTASLNPTNNSMVSSKYYNNLISVGDSTNTNVESFESTEDASLVSTFDLSGNGTAIHNTAATSGDNLLAKIVGGNLATNANGDFIGFMPNGQMTIYRTGGGAGGTDYLNYTAMVNAANRVSDSALGRSKVDVIANLDVIEPLRAADAKTVNDILAVSSTSYRTTFSDFIKNTYGNTSTENPPAPAATNFFDGLGSSYFPLTVFSVGSSQTDSGYSGAYQVASFENAAPLVYSNLEHLFMSVVAVGASTSGVSGISANSDSMPVAGVKYHLAQWQDTGGTGNYYKSRVCGVAGTGANGVDPWCFAAVGRTDEYATAAAAGAAGVLRSAFDYMTPQQIFTLLALTADGPFLARTTSDNSISTEDLISRLSSLYDMPAEYQFRINNGENYLDVFKEVYGYGVINLERATMPGTRVYFRSGADIVSESGPAYWRAATNTNLRGSSALNLGGVSISTSAYDVLESVDGSMSMPRIWKNNLTFSGGTRHSLYMGDVLADLRTQKADPDTDLQIGDLSFSLSRSDRAYSDSMSGVDNMRLAYRGDKLDLTAEYQHYLTDTESRFYGMSNPILNLASNAVKFGAGYRFGNWRFGASAFSGNVTDESLLETDPAISFAYEPMKIGTISGVASNFGWHDDTFGLSASAGVVSENNTVLGAYATGLLEMQNTETNYIDIDAFWRPTDWARLRARATFAHSTPNSEYDAAMSLSELSSNAFAFGADVGNLSLGVSMPLAVVRGHMNYAYADYDVVESDSGRYDLVVSNASVRRLDMVSNVREYRFNAALRHNFGEFTDGAIGFVYRINPNNTRDFGNESIFMFKVTHNLGI